MECSVLSRTIQDSFGGGGHPIVFRLQIWLSCMFQLNIQNHAGLGGTLVLAFKSNVSIAWISRPFLQTNTFQCIIGTDGSQSFVGLLYADDMIQWMTGDADGGINGLGGDRADVGLVSEDPNNSFFLPASNTSAVLMLDSTSNVDNGGLWIFRVDQDVVIEPSKPMLYI